MAVCIMGNISPFADTDTICEEPQVAIGSNAGIELPQGTCGSIARIYKGLFVLFTLLPIQSLEIRFQHQYLTPDFQKCRNFGAPICHLQAKRNAANGFQVQGHILSDVAISTGGSRDKHAVLIAEAYGQTIEFRLYRILGVIDAEGLAHASIECFYLTLRECIAQGKHRGTMNDLGKRFERRNTDALSGGIGRYELRMTLLELLQFAEQLVEVRIGNRRGVQLVITGIMQFDCIAQFPHMTRYFAQ